jgi:hypothetical protein
MACCCRTHACLCLRAWAHACGTRMRVCPHRRVLIICLLLGLPLQLTVPSVAVACVTLARTAFANQCNWVVSLFEGALDIPCYMCCRSGGCLVCAGQAWPPATGWRMPAAAAAVALIGHTYARVSPVSLEALGNGLFGCLGRVPVGLCAACC